MKDSLPDVIGEAVFSSSSILGLLFQAQLNEIIHIGRC